MYNKAINDKEFGIKLAAIFSNRELCVLSDQSGNTIRSYVLRIMQKRYERKLKNHILSSSLKENINNLSSIHNLLQKGQT